MFTRLADLNPIDVAQAERAEMKRVRISRNLNSFADILSRVVEIFAEHSAIKLYTNIGNISFQPMQ